MVCGFSQSFVDYLFICRILIQYSRRRQWQPTPVLLPGKSHGWRSLVGCSPWGCEESGDWATSLSLFTFILVYCESKALVCQGSNRFFLEFSCFLLIQPTLAIWYLTPLHFLNPAWTSGSSWFMYCWSLAWRIMSNTLLAWSVMTSSGRSMGQYDSRENPVDQMHVCSGTHPQCEVKTFDKGCTSWNQDCWEKYQ